MCWGEGCWVKADTKQHNLIQSMVIITAQRIDLQHLRFHCSLNFVDSSLGFILRLFNGGAFVLKLALNFVIKLLVPKSNQILNFF